MYGIVCLVFILFETCMELSCLYIVWDLYGIVCLVFILFETSMELYVLPFYCLRQVWNCMSCLFIVWDLYGTVCLVFKLFETLMEKYVYKLFETLMEKYVLSCLRCMLCFLFTDCHFLQWTMFCKKQMTVQIYVNQMALSLNIELFIINTYIYCCFDDTLSCI